MSSRLEKMRSNPAAGWQIGDIESVCRENSVSCDPPRGGGSHYKIRSPLMLEILTIPAKRPIKPVYIRKLIAFVDAIKAKS